MSLNLMRYGLDLEIYHSKSIKDQCGTNPSGLAIYYKISAYKYYIKGLLNDANIYMKFNYLFIDKFITSSSRRFSKTIFLSQQGFKLSKVFCIFKSIYNTTINKNNFNIINKVIASKLSTTSLIKEVEELTYDKYVESTNTLHIEYINSFLKAEVNYKEYPSNASYTEQIAWLYTNVKKPREVFMAHMLFNNNFNKTNLGIVYELDATSS
jgi:hypothetical protein